MEYQEFCALPIRTYPLHGIPLFGLPGIVPSLPPPYVGGSSGGGSGGEQFFDSYKHRTRQENDLMEMAGMIIISGILDN